MQLSVIRCLDKLERLDSDDGIKLYQSRRGASGVERHEEPNRQPTTESGGRFRKRKIKHAQTLAYAPRACRTWIANSVAQLEYTGGVSPNPRKFR